MHSSLLTAGPNHRPLGLAWRRADHGRPVVWWGVCRRGETGYLAASGQQPGTAKYCFTHWPDAISSYGGISGGLAADGHASTMGKGEDSGAAIHRLQRLSDPRPGLRQRAAPGIALRAAPEMCEPLSGACDPVCPRRPSVLAPSWRSIDPCDAVVGRAIFEEMTEHTLLCYERTACANCGSRPCSCCSPQMRSVAMIRPWWRRPGAKAPDLVGPAVEVLEFACTAAEDAVPAFSGPRLRIPAGRQRCRRPLMEHRQTCVTTLLALVTR